MLIFKNKIQKRILVYSSLIFITNALTALYKGYYLYSFLFVCLTVTSVLFHSTYKKIYYYIDKISILCIVCYGTYMLYQKSEIKSEIKSVNTLKILFIITTFLATIFLYYYGYCTNNYCYHVNKDISNKYHGLIHCISSIGHHCIILL